MGGRQIMVSGEERSVNAPCRIFACDGRMDRPIAGAQIIHLWRAALDRRRPHRARRVSGPREGMGWVALWSAIVLLAARRALSRMPALGRAPRAFGALVPSGAR